MSSLTARLGIVIFAICFSSSCVGITSKCLLASIEACKIMLMGYFSACRQTSVFNFDIFLRLCLKPDLIILFVYCLSVRPFICVFITDFSLGAVTLIGTNNGEVGIGISWGLESIPLFQGFILRNSPAEKSDKKY